MLFRSTSFRDVLARIRIQRSTSASGVPAGTDSKDPKRGGAKSGSYNSSED